MAKRNQHTTDKLKPAGSSVRPGIRRIIHWLLHTGKLPALLVAGLAGWGIYDALVSPHYRVRRVEAAGIEALTTAEVAALAAVDGEPIWFVDTAAVVDRVKQSPYVERAAARLVLPDRLEVRVAERKPEVRWLHKGIAYAVTAEGLIVDGAPALDAEATLLQATESLSATEPLTSSPDLVPKGEAASPEYGLESGDGSELSTTTVAILDTTPNRPLKVGDHVDVDALQLARRLILRAPAEIPVPVTRIEFDAGLGVSLILGEGRQVVLGRSNDLDRKLATLRYLLNDNTQFKYLDLRPSTPFYRQ